MKIKNVILTPSYTGFYFDDQQAIKKGAKLDGFNYLGEPVTPGFTKIRQTGEAISIQLILEDGSVAYGDCAAVQYSGTGGRDPLFLAEDFIPYIEENIVPLLIGTDVSHFRSLAEKFDKIEINNKRLHTAIRYGLTQAFLHASALVNKVTMAEIIRKEYGINSNEYRPIDVFTQSGDDRYINADKMIIKHVDVLPHALINNVETKLGFDGEILLEYVKWLRKRIETLRTDQNYKPILHIDTYGTIGIAFNYNMDQIKDYMRSLALAAQPFKLRIEGPVDTGDREGTMKYLRDLTKFIDEERLNLEIVADEWCNTLDDIKYFADNKAGHMLQIKTPDLGGVNNIAEAILYCNTKNIGSYCGGTCNETNISAQVSANIAVACEATQVLAKPGMGVDEGFMIIKNEINRVVALANSRKI